MAEVAVDGRQYLVSARELTDRLLREYLPSREVEPKSLHEAMRYSVLAGGKRLRPALVLAAFEHCTNGVGSASEVTHPAMAAVEVVHTYSLIHDDLPCMDDDDLRRGQLTCHMKFGEALAVLAGDALHVLAFRLMAETGSVAAVRELADAVGTSGMLGGQIADIEAEGKAVTRDDMVGIHSRKTGALIRASVRIGALLAEAPGELLERLSVYGEKIGLAFQIIDDILDIEGDQQLMGKQVGSDSRNRKATYPAAVGLEQSRREATSLLDEAVAVLDRDGDNMLKFLARYIGQRAR